jgi:hypothetical protein
LKRKSRNRLLFGCAVLVVLVLSQICYPWLWWSNRIVVTVTDKESGNAVAGAIVVATWSFTGLEGSVRDVIGAEEAVTGKDGVALVPGWGPRLNFASYALGGLLSPGGFDEIQPLVYVLRTGYYPKVRYAHFPATGFSTQQKPEDDGIRVGREKLDSIEGSRYQSAIEGILRSLGPVYTGKGCMWKRIPQAVNFLELAYAPMRPRDVNGAAPPFNEVAKDRCRPVPAYITGGGE